MANDLEHSTTTNPSGASHIDPGQVEELRRLKSVFLDDYEAQNQWREDKRKYGRFYDGDQLTEEELRELGLRGQPAVVINRIKPKMDAIFGIVQELGVETKAYPVGDRENEAAFISEKFREIENNSHFNEEELQVFKDLTIDGVGYFETKHVWDGLESRIVTQHLPNEFVVEDKHSRRSDHSDAKHIYKHVWKELGDAKAMFPKHVDELEAAVNGSDVWGKLLGEQLSQYRPDQYSQPGGTKALMEGFNNDFADYVDQNRRQLRIVTKFYRTLSVKRFIQAGGITKEVTGESESEINKIRQSFENAQEWTQNEKVLNSITFCWNGILERKENIRGFDRHGKFPITRAEGYMTRDPKNRRAYGLVKQHLDPQMEVNKRRSKMLHLLNVSQVWYEQGAFDDDESKARAEAARPDGWIAHRPNFKVDRVTHEQLATSQYELLQEAKAEIDQSGVNKEIEGQGRPTSGREFQLRLKEGLKSIRELMTNIRAARRRVAEYWLDEILEDAKAEAKKQKVPFEMTRFDVVIEEAIESVNLQAETFSELVQLQGNGVPIPPDILIQLSPIAPKFKNQILQRWQQQPPQPPQPAGKRSSK